MRDSRLPEKGPVSSTSAHLTGSTLEQLAEGMLPEPERARARSHIEACARCRAELDGFEALFAVLEGLPRFAPSPEFGDAVMARVRVAPQGSLGLARAYHWLPKTRRGWMLLSVALAAPALPVIALVAWVITHPLVSPSSLWEWASLQVQDGARTGVAYLMTWSSSSGLLPTAQQAYAALSAVPMTTLAAVAGVLAIAIPLSMWSLVRLTRTPMEDISYAN